MTVTLGTRGSDLALWQTNWAIARLKAAWPALEFEARTFTTAGDRDRSTPLPKIGGKGLFTEEIENALRAGEIDMAVHSLKDLPVDDAPGIRLGAIGERADARDVLIAPRLGAGKAGGVLAALPPGAAVGTCSLRRSAQLLAARPDLTVRPVRGNVETRIRKAQNGEYEALVLAAAGVTRLGLEQHIAAYLSFEMMLPAPGQGALAVQCRADDEKTQKLLSAIDDWRTRRAVTAERAFLQALGGGCSAPVAAFACADASDGKLRLWGLVASPDGSNVIRAAEAGDDPATVAAQLAERVLAEGAGVLLG